MKKKNRENRRKGALERLEAVNKPNERQEQEIETLKKRLKSL
jgi:predicted PP-loop superfamily ATPase